jgi:hypothetical protein
MKSLLNRLSKESGLLLFLLSFLLILASESCQKDEKTIPEQVTGNWEWVKTIIPYSQEETNPMTDGFSMNLEFSANGMMKEYKSGLLTGTSKYSIAKDKYGFVLSSTIITSHFYFVNDTLIFSEAYVDGPASYYKRSR